MTVLVQRPKEIDAVFITAADYNPGLWGTEHNPFDGSPFSEVPDWLKDALNGLRLIPHTRGSTDYAQWDFYSSDLKRVEATLCPGDIIYMDGPYLRYMYAGQVKQEWQVKEIVANIEGHAHGNVIEAFNKLMHSSVPETTNDNNGVATPNVTTGSLSGDSSSPSK